MKGNTKMNNYSNIVSNIKLAKKLMQENIKLVETLTDSNISNHKYNMLNTSKEYANGIISSLDVYSTVAEGFEGYFNE